MIFENYIHIYPLNDLQEHKLKGNDCDCLPTTDFKRELIIHNSFDGREAVEEANEILSELAGKDKR